MVDFCCCYCPFSNNSLISVLPCGSTDVLLELHTYVYIQEMGKEPESAALPVTICLLATRLHLVRELMFLLEVAAPSSACTQGFWDTMQRKCRNCSERRESFLVMIDQGL